MSGESNLVCHQNPAIDPNLHNYFKPKKEDEKQEEDIDDEENKENVYTNINLVIFAKQQPLGEKKMSRSNE